MQKDPVFIIAEIGINHNGDINIAKQLIDAAAVSGANAVKFQKRTLERVYTKAELSAARESPWGKSNYDQKAGLEFEKAEYDEINRYCNEKKIHWLASAWDVESQKFLQQYNLKYNKVCSARIGHRELLEMIADEGRHTFISTGMSHLDEIASVVEIFRARSCSFEIMHCTSTYPAKIDELNLSCITTLRERFKCNVGYSGHERGIYPSIATVALGATSVERHLTLDRDMYGSDQAASIEPQAFMDLVRAIRHVERALGDGVKKIYEAERPIIEKLKRAHDISL